MADVDYKKYPEDLGDLMPWSEEIQTLTSNLGNEVRCFNYIIIAVIEVRCF